MGTPGSESGLEKRTGGNTGTALQADSTDAAMGALLCRLAADGVAGVSQELEQTLRFTVAAASLACTRPGAYAPTAHEVEEHLAAAGA